MQQLRRINDEFKATRLQLLRQADNCLETCRQCKLGKNGGNPNYVSFCRVQCPHSIPKHLEVIYSNIEENEKRTRLQKEAFHLPIKAVEGNSQRTKTKRKSKSTKVRSKSL